MRGVNLHATRCVLKARVVSKLRKCCSVVTVEVISSDSTIIPEILYLYWASRCVLNHGVEENKEGVLPFFKVF